MVDGGASTATRVTRSHPLSAQERMALKGWIGPLPGLPEGPPEVAAPAEPADSSDPALQTAVGPVATEPSVTPPAVAAGWQQPLAVGVGGRRVERRRAEQAERRGIAELVGGADAVLRRLDRRDLTLIGLSTTVGLLTGSVFF